MYHKAESMLTIVIISIPDRGQCSLVTFPTFVPNLIENDCDYARTPPAR